MNVMLLVLSDRKRALEAKGVMGRVDIITGTLGKAWEGAMDIHYCQRKKLLNASTF
jgi:hypothetical protein